MPTCKIYSVSDENFKQIVSTCKTWSDIGRKLGYTETIHKYGRGLMNGDARRKLKARAAKLQINVEHIDGGRKFDMDLNKIGHQYRREKKTLKKMLERSKRMYICEHCDCKGMEMGDKGEWQWEGRDLILEINHKFGTGFEGCNHIKNLQYLCSRCHTQHTHLFMQAKHYLKHHFVAAS